jgi:hypothetical protein
MSESAKNKPTSDASLTTRRSPMHVQFSNHTWPPVKSPLNRCIWSWTTAWSGASRQVAQRQFLMHLELPGYCPISSHKDGPDKPPFRIGRQWTAHEMAVPLLWYPYIHDHSHGEPISITGLEFSMNQDVCGFRMREKKRKIVVGWNNHFGREFRWRKMWLDSAKFLTVRALIGRNKDEFCDRATCFVVNSRISIHAATHNRNETDTWIDSLIHKYVFRHMARWNLSICADGSTNPIGIQKERNASLITMTSWWPVGSERKT